MIEIGEQVGQHPRTPGPRLMRREGTGMARELERRAVMTLRLAAELEEEAEAFRAASESRWLSEWGRARHGAGPRAVTDVAMAAD